MIKQETARAIYCCYAEIINSEKLLADIEDEEKRLEEERKAAHSREDLKERQPCYELGVPNFFNSEKDRSMRIFHVNPAMAKAVIVSHQANQKARLVELNERAKIEANTEEA